MQIKESFEYDEDVSNVSISRFHVKPPTICTLSGWGRLAEVTLYDFLTNFFLKLLIYLKKLSADYLLIHAQAEFASEKKINKKMNIKSFGISLSFKICLRNITENLCSSHIFSSYFLNIFHFITGYTIQRLHNQKIQTM